MSAGLCRAEEQNWSIRIDTRTVPKKCENGLGVVPLYYIIIAPSYQSFMQLLGIRVGLGLGSLKQGSMLLWGWEGSGDAGTDEVEKFPTGRSKKGH